MKYLKVFASLKLAVFVILSLALSCIVGTVLESAYDTATAKYWVYRSLFFKGILLLLAINIFSVMVSRIPWKKHHASFIFAHIGILLLLTGSWITERFGLDGTLRIEEGETANVVELDEAHLVFSEGDKNKVVPVQWIPYGVKFKPITVSEYGIRADQFLNHADPDFLFVDGPGGSPWIKVKLTGGPMKIAQEFQLWGGDPSWNTLQAGPARLMIFKDAQAVPEALLSALTGQPWVAFFPAKNSSEISYQAGSSISKKIQKGTLAFKEGQPLRIPLTWKGNVVLEVLGWKPMALSDIKYRESKILYGQQAPPSAIHLTTDSDEARRGAEKSEVWLGLGERATLQKQGRQISIGYYPRRVSLPFALKLLHFKIDRYPGNMAPKEYASQVSVLDEASPDRGQVPINISMNEPLKHRDIAFYQASYEEAQPRPTVSIFSVNRDPGRQLKYWGCIFLVLGIIWLFGTRWKKRVTS